MNDTQPRYTTKRLHDEIDHARRLGRLEALQEAAAIVDDSVGEYEKAAGGSDGVAHDAMLMAGDALELVRDAIHEKISAVLASSPREEDFPKYRNLVNGDLCELVSQDLDGVAFRRVGSTQLAYLGHSEFGKRFELIPPRAPVTFGGAGKAMEALKPLADAVFNDNGDMTVSVPLLSAEECIQAYFAVKRIREADYSKPASNYNPAEQVIGNSQAPAELSVGSEPVAWTTKGNLETLASSPKEARYMWGLPSGSTISVPLYASPQAPAERVTGWEAEEKLTVEEAWTILCETPDITSPEEYPDHALITMEQLGSFMARAAKVEGVADV